MALQCERTSSQRLQHVEWGRMSCMKKLRHWTSGNACRSLDMPGSDWLTTLMNLGFGYWRITLAVQLLSPWTRVKV